MVDLCEQEGLVFLPWAPIQESDQLVPVRTAAERHNVSTRQIAIAWLLNRSPQILPIPGSGSPDHVAQNVAAAAMQLTNEEANAIFNLAA
jgi:pyridoxine 4-dehydrogenase